MAFQTGDILAVTWDDRPIRVLQTDPIETFYDAELEEVGWVIARARTATYYRMRTAFLERTASLSASKPFSLKEDAKFRPDLPMRLFRHHSADWSDDLVSLIALEADISIPAKQIVIIPFGPKGGDSKPVRAEALSGESLTLRTIIETARTAQHVRCPDVTGTGLYRSGIVGGIPSYYLWGAVDRAGHAD